MGIRRKITRCQCNQCKTCEKDVSTRRVWRWGGRGNVEGEEHVADSQACRDRVLLDSEDCAPTPVARFLHDTDGAHSAG